MTNVRDVANRPGWYQTIRDGEAVNEPVSHLQAIADAQAQADPETYDVDGDAIE